VSPDPGGVTRRAFGIGLVGVAASTALVTTGCNPDEPLDLPGLPAVDEEPDLDRVVTALDDEQRMLDVVVRVRRRHRQLRRTLAATESVHAAHVDLLSRAVETPQTPGGNGRDRPRVPDSPADAVAELVRLERSLADRHVDTAVRSSSGVLARVVAAMSAAAAQQAVVLASVDRG
jgi:hypothetical protein